MHDGSYIPYPIKVAESDPRYNAPKSSAQAQVIPSTKKTAEVEVAGKDDSLGENSLQAISGDHRSLLTSPINTSPPDLLSTGILCNPDFASDEPFPLGIDRGRFPALRRRRGNKFYTPDRPSTTNAKHTVDRLTEFGAHICQESPANNLGIAKHNIRNGSGKFTTSYPTENIPSQDILKNESAKRINSDQILKELTRIVASGKASPSQVNVFEKYINSVGATIPFQRSKGNAQADMPSESLQSQLHSDLRQMEALQRTANSMIAPLRRELLSVSQPLATALDPDLELLAAIQSIYDSAIPPAREQGRYRVTEEDQEELSVVQNIIKDTTRSKLVRIETKIIDPAYRPQRTISSILRHRELGSSRRGDITKLRLRNAEMIEPWRYWKGASGDIVAAAWAPDSTTYAVGAAAPSNDEDLQYNRPCNLLLGELASNTLTELPNHRVDRPRPETISNGPNATQAVYEACDPMVYKTVTSIGFSSTGKRMYTASIDQTVKVWDVLRKRCIATFAHDAWVTSIEASTQRPGLFATASKCIHNSIRIYYSQDSEDSICRTQFSSSRAQKKPVLRIFPECLRWGPTAHISHLLLAGFQQLSDDGDGNVGEGHLLLWDANTFQTVKVSPFSQSVYAAAWHPTQSIFATGGAPGQVITDRYNTKSVVRTWDVRSSTGMAMEYECSAIDMQDVTFSPLDSNIVTAGCTDSTSFVWDFRRPDQPLHRLRHGRPITGWDQGEEADTGVMMSVWGLGGSLFYTGSSDGMIKAWDIRRHPQDVLIRNVAQFGAGIQSGAFSPDGTNLLVGDADGGVHVLSSAPCGPRTDLYDRGSNCREEPITLIRAPDGSGRRINQADDNPGAEAREAANELIRSGQLEYHSELGVCKGPNYRGAYATHL